MQNAPDFNDEEKKILSEPLARDALAASGVLIEELRPKPPPKDAVRAEHLEKRRQYKWELVRRELERLLVLQERAMNHADARAGAPLSDRTPQATCARTVLEAAVCRSLTEHARSATIDWEIEEKRKQMEERLANAEHARARRARERVQAIAAAHARRELRADLRADARTVALKLNDATAKQRPSSAPPTRTYVNSATRQSEGASRARSQMEVSEAARRDALAERLAAREQVFEMHRQQKEFERQRKRILNEQVDRSAAREYRSQGSTWCERVSCGIVAYCGAGDTTAR